MMLGSFLVVVDACVYVYVCVHWNDCDFKVLA